MSGYSDYYDYSDEKKPKKGICSSSVVFGAIIAWLLLGGGIAAAVLISNKNSEAIPDVKSGDVPVETTNTGVIGGELFLLAFFAFLFMM